MRKKSLVINRLLRIMLIVAMVFANTSFISAEEPVDPTTEESNIEQSNDTEDTFENEDSQKNQSQEIKKATIPKKIDDGIVPLSEPEFTVSVVPNSDSEVALTESGTHLTVNRKSSFLIKVKAEFPTNMTTDKSIKISLPYGMTWCYASEWYPSYNFIDTTSAWYQELKTPVNTVGITKTTPLSITTDGGGKRNLYTDQDVSFNFKDGLNSVEFELGVKTIDSVIGYTGLTSIQDAIVVTREYNNGTPVAIDKKLSLTLKGDLPLVTNVRTIGTTLNGDGEIEIGEGNDSGNNVYWVAKPGESNTRNMISSYSLSYLVPSNVSFKEIKKYYSTAITISITPDSPVMTAAGENLTLSDGTTYTVPDGMKVYTFKVNESLAYLPSDTAGHGCFMPVWSFADSSIKGGDKITVSMLDVNMKYYGQTDALIYDRDKLPSFTYKIVAEEEEVFTNVAYGDKNGTQSGYVSDYLLNRGSKLYLGKQEYTSGYFIVGNRGTGDSAPKTLHIVYDTNNTGIMGVTEQEIPRNKDVSGVADTQVTNFKVKVWDGKNTSSVSNWITVDINTLTTLRITDVPGYESTTDFYLKEIQYDIDKIPAQTVWGSSSNTSGKSFVMYGTVLTDDIEPKSNQSHYISTLEIIDQDEAHPNGTQLGRNYTGFTGKIAVGATLPMFDNSGINVIAGKKASINQTLTLGSADGANTIDEAYFISPYGDELTNIKVTYDENTKHLWASDKANEIQPKITEIPATDELKVVYPNARVYKFDFTKITKEQEFYDARVLGNSVITQKAYEEKKYSSLGASSQFNNRIKFTADMSISVKDPVGTVGTMNDGTQDGLIWVKMSRPDDLSQANFVGTNWVEDKYNFTGDPSTLLNSRGSLTIKAMSDVGAVSSAKMNTEPESAYRTYDGNETSLVGANSPVNYKLNILNATGKTAKGVEVYFPIPKTGQNWGVNLTPNGAFKFDMALLDKGSIPEGYTVYYAKSVTPSGEKTTWDSYTWTESVATNSWTKADWDAVNFVKIVKSEILDGTDDVFNFNLKVQNVTKEQMNTVNIWQPYYLRILDSVSSFKPGDPVATTLVPGEVGGRVWYDANANGNIDEGEAVIPNTTVELYDLEGHLKQTIKTDADGKYLFDGLLETAIIGLGTLEEKQSPLFTVKVINPTDPSDTTNKDRYIEFTTKTDSSDMKFVAESDQKTASVTNVSSKVEETSLQTNAGLIKEKDLVGGLKVNKTITGTASKENKLFEFTVKLGEKLTGQYGDMTFTNGIATFKLGDGESKTASGLPSRITYNVVETSNKKYETTKTGDSGTIGIQTLQEAAFTNHRDLPPVTISGKDLPAITKAFTATSPERPDPQTFSFTMVAKDGAPESQTSRATVSDDGVATSFGNITLTEAGTYTYTISETVGAQQGYQYDDSTYEYEIKVEEQDGNLVVTDKKIYKVEDDKRTKLTGNAITFTNDYKYTPVEVNAPSVTKAVTTEATNIPNIEVVKQAPFIFNLQPRGTYGTAVTNGTQTKTVTATGSAVNGTDESLIANFDAVTFNTPGTYTFDITETSGSTTGYKYDSKVYVWNVVVIDSKDGLKATNSLKVKDSATTKDDNATTATKIEFKNEFETVEVPYYFPAVTKVFTTDSTTRPTTNKETFNFKIDAVSATTTGNTPIPKSDWPKLNNSTCSIEGEGSTAMATSTTNKGTGFGLIESFPVVGTYVYKITEVAPTTPSKGYSYDDSEYILTVVVTKEGETQNAVGTLIKSGTPTSSAAPANAVVFSNEYLVPPVKVVTPDISKAFDSTSAIRPVAKDYAFTINRDATTSPLPKETTVTIKDPGDKEKKVENAFGDITFTQPGTYKYTIKEQNNGGTGYTYATSKYTWTVKVTDEHGEFKTTTTLKKDNDTVDIAAFKNKYDVKPVTTTTNDLPTIIKAFDSSSQERPTKKEFTFDIKAKDNAPLGTKTTAKITGEGTVTSANTFDNITFTKAGTYVYEITENKPVIIPNGYTYDESVYKYTVVVADNNGSLYIKSTEIKKGENSVTDVKFVNTYKTTDVTLNEEDFPIINKAFTTDSSPRADSKTFTFNIVPQGIAPSPTKTNASIVGEGAVEKENAFGNITFTNAGTYTYLIKETAGSDTGYTYDDSVYSYKVKVEDVDGTLTITNKSLVKGSTPETEITFTNSYKAPASVSTEIKGTKTLTENSEAKTMTEGQFNFAIEEDSSNNTNGYKDFTAGSKDVKADGTFTFGNVTFTNVGTYKFIVSEDNKGAAGYTYDNQPVTVTYVVGVDSSTNKLQILQTTYRKNNENVTGITFANTYATPDSSTVTFSGQKNLTGGDKSNASIQDKQFSFSIVAGSSNDTKGYTGFTAGSKECSQGGAFSFDTITFTKVGTYTFDITEKDAKAAGYTYDSKTVVATVEVTLDKSTNKLKTSVSYKKDGEDVTGITFDNKYKAPTTVDVDLTGQKTLDGQKETKDIKKGQFTFNIVSDAANHASGFTGLKSTASVKEGGDIDFEKLTFSKAGTYNFTITENDLGKTGYTYDKTSYGVKVVVTLNEKTNELEAKTTMTKGEAKETVKAITFANTYNAKPVSSDPPTEKVIKGNPNTSSDFTFVLTAQDKKFPMPSGSHDGVKEMTRKGAGSVEFGDITFTQPGTYVYEITEKNTGVKYYTYDTSVITVTYEVVDDDGTLKVTRTFSNDKGEEIDLAAFTNVYNDKDADGGNKDKGDGDNTSNENGTPTSQNKENAKTGDTTDITSLVTMMLVALGAIVSLLVKTKKKDVE